MWQGLAVAALLLPWREDGLCGELVDAPDGSIPARCNPWDKDSHTCCSTAGRCMSPGLDIAAHPAKANRGGDGARGAAADEDTTCDVDYAIRQAWRADGQCGEDMKGADGTEPAQCNPLHAHNVTCCSDAGWCGAWPSYEHCRCGDCVNYYAPCACADESPCQDPGSGLCYPRTLSSFADVATEMEAATRPVDASLPSSRAQAEAARRTLQGMLYDSTGRPIDPKFAAANLDRDPRLDPKRTMKDQARRRALLEGVRAGKADVGQRPLASRSVHVVASLHSPPTSLRITSESPPNSPPKRIAFAGRARVRQEVHPARRQARHGILAKAAAGSRGPPVCDRPGRLYGARWWYITAPAGRAAALAEATACRGRKGGQGRRRRRWRGRRRGRRRGQQRGRQ